MIALISPAKRIRSDIAFLEAESSCLFPVQTQKIMQELKKKNLSELKELLDCNEKIALQAYKDTQQWDLSAKGVPALFAFDGIQYQKMGASVFDDVQLAYMKKHVVILSALYGVLRCMDGILPYRLELENDLLIQSQNLYETWSNLPAQYICQQDSLILDLASVQYSRLIRSFLPKNCQMVRCFFMEEEKGRRVEKGVYVKMARGRMVRYLAENQIQDLAGVKAFCELGYVFDDEHSDETHFIFVRKKQIKNG